MSPLQQHHHSHESLIVGQEEEVSADRHTPTLSGRIRWRSCNLESPGTQAWIGTITKMAGRRSSSGLAATSAEEPRG